MKKIIYSLILLTFNLSFAQDYTNSIKSYLQQNRSNLNLEQQDYSDINITSQSHSKSLQADNVYVEQRFRGIKIHNAISSFVLREGSVISAQLAFTNNIALKANTTQPSVSALAAISNAASELGLPAPTGLNLIETVGNNSYVFSDGNISINNIPVTLVYQGLNDNQTLRLAWDVSIYKKDAQNYYSVRIDALTGKLLEINDWVASCNFEAQPHSHTMEATESVLFSKKSSADFHQPVVNGSAYRVFPIPFGAPNDGDDILISDPSNVLASPFGWHDTDGVAGAEYTTTRGNNVLAKEDIAGNNGAGMQAEGGATLQFDFPFDLPQNPSNYTEAAITNLFYMNNIMHDVFYQYGFDEESGNFQANNYGNGGAEGDHVVAEAQDGGGLNNANFMTPPDGYSGRMQMYLWSAPQNVLGTFMTVNNGALAGDYYAHKSAFTGGGTPLPTTPITANLALIEDDNSGNSTDPHDGCDNVTNASELSGKIVVIRRGECGFAQKVQAAEDAGAVAVVMVNDIPGDPIRMGGSGAGLGIPSIMIFKSDGDAIIDALLNGETISTTLVDDGSGTDFNQRDGDVDNTIVAHEYGHGISNRLTGGPAAAGCLQNEEQMGEGWSDYFALMLTMLPGESGEDVRGMGTYISGESRAGGGIRTKPYTTDMSINNFTYNSIKSQVAPHGVGSVWATMLWDLTWAFVDEYGFDEDIYNGTGGNNMALQLVVDGLKLQRCSPGFIDGRDAILEADEIINGGANKCLIWNVFARRGLGFSANQGSVASKQDGTEAFDVPADCPLGTANNEIENNFIIYPNPSNGHINIKSRFDLGNTKVSIYDINGRLVFNKQVELHHTALIDASELSTGMYMITVEGGDKTQTSKLIIK